MVVLNDRQMFECKVLYIGSAPPIDTLEGTEALQEPLRQRYPEDLRDVRGIDSILRVRPDCLEMVQKGSEHSPIQFPLDRLKICAAVRACKIRDATSGENIRQFVPLNTISPETSQPAIFAAIIRRSQGREIAECHAFVCSSPREALHLVNTTAAANLNLKALKGQRMSESVKYQDGVPVIHDVQNGHGAINGEEVRYVMGEGAEEQYNLDDDNTVYIKSSIVKEEVPAEVTSEPVRHYVDDSYQYQQRQEVVSPNPKTIYIKFDKSNLVPTGHDTMELQPSTIKYQAPQPRPVVMQAPVPAQPRVIRAIAPPPQIPVVYRRPMSPRPLYVRTPPPQPIVVRRPPPPPPQVFMPPPQPMMIRPPPSRMYTRRVMSPPPTLVPPAPVYYKTRARSSSPDFTRSEMKARVIQTNKYQPKWRSHSSDIVEYRQSRRDMVPQGPPMGPPTMFMNERAFARRVNTDNRFSQYAVPGYNYPTAYDFNDVMMYDRPISKSNPRYSSSDSDEGDLRFRKKR